MKGAVFEQKHGEDSWWWCWKDVWHQCWSSEGPGGGWAAAAGWMKVHSPWKRLLSGWWSEQQLDGCEGGSAESWLSFPLLPFLWRTLVMVRVATTGDVSVWLSSTHTKNINARSEHRASINRLRDPPVPLGLVMLARLRKWLKFVCAAITALVEACYHWCVFVRNRR